MCRRRKLKAVVSASALSQMGVCERLVVFEHLAGKRVTLAQEVVLRRGLTAHRRFASEASLDGLSGEPSLGGCCSALQVPGEEPKTTEPWWLRDPILRLSHLARNLILSYCRVGMLMFRAMERWPLRRVAASAGPARGSLDMPDDYWLLATVTVAGTAALWTALRLVCRRCGKDAAWPPKALMGDGLAYVERTFRSDAYPRIVARVDRGYRSRQGTITLVEMKTRRNDRIHLSDIIELSAQSLALSSETGEPVASSAFVVVQFADGRRTHRVELMSKGEVKDLVRRRADLLAGRLVPRTTDRPRLCATCAYRTRCHRGLVVVGGDERRMEQSRSDAS